MAERRSPVAGFAARFEAAGARGDLHLAELPFLAHINLRVDPASHTAEKIALALDVPFLAEPGTTVRSGELSVLGLGPDEWLVVGPDGTQRELMDRIGTATGNEHVSVVDVSAQRTTLLVAGARARDLLAHGCALDLHPQAFGTGTCAQTLLARTQVVLVARDADEPEFWLLCRSSFADYVAAWLLDAATEYVSGEL